MISFSKPCLQWKLFAAYKTHWGFPGLLKTPVPGYVTRYLAKSVRLLQTEYISPTQNPVIADFTDVNTIDRITGARTTPPNLQTFPDPTAGIPVDARWTVLSDSHATFYQGPTHFNPVTTFYDVNLSNEYTLEQLEDDVDALLAGIDPNTVPPMNLKQVVYPGDAGNSGNLGIVAGEAIPGAYLSATLGPPGSQSYLSHEGVLKAAAFTAYIPAAGLLGNGTYLQGPVYFPGLAKLASMVAMAGNYCLKTFVVDYAQQAVGAPQCVTGQGSCGDWFTVRAPDLIPGGNTYKLVVPNCRCGD